MIRAVGDGSDKGSTEMSDRPADPPLFYERHVFMCINTREAGHKRGCCSEKG